MDATNSNGTPPINSDVRSHGRQVIMLHVDGIELGKRHREVDAAAVDLLATSLSSIGLRTPISVRHYEPRPDWLPGPPGDAMLLLSGAHRLAAAKQLGWQQIECIVYFDGDEIDAELWEIAENLHRAELTKAQRDDHIRRYAELLAKRQAETPQTAAKLSVRGRRGEGRPSGVASKIAAETGLSKDTVERALNPQRVEEERQRREAAKAERAAEQAEFDRQREEAHAALPSFVRQIDDFRRQATEAAAPDPDALQAEIAELREANASLEAEVARLKADLAEFEGMRVLYEQGGFAKVIAGKDEEIRVLTGRVETESADKVSYMRSADFWKAEADRLGRNDDIIIHADGSMERVRG